MAISGTATASERRQRIPRGYYHTRCPGTPQQRPLCSVTPVVVRLRFSQVEDALAARYDGL
ncbi:hypothetical protein GQ600_3314 [Phytophthora cactorum]|nr:hypothetical protein GQ600_3314 [Phytophthora cactorum]